MGCSCNLPQKFPAGPGFSQKPRALSRIFSAGEILCALKYAAIPLAAGSSATRPKEKPAAGAMTKSAETANASAAPAPVRSPELCLPDRAVRPKRRLTRHEIIIYCSQPNDPLVAEVRKLQGMCRRWKNAQRIAGKCCDRNPGMDRDLPNNLGCLISAPRRRLAFAQASAFLTGKFS